jgi:hypothetical protein
VGARPGGGEGDLKYLPMLVGKAHAGVLAAHRNARE